MRSFHEDDLRLAYHFIRNFSGAPCDYPEVRDEMIIEYKRAIRAFYKRQEQKDRRCVYEDPAYGYYTMLIEFPDWIHSREVAEEWFHGEEEMHCAPSMYDCTGQHFTIRYKLVERRGRWYCYHHIGIDI